MQLKIGYLFQCPPRASPWVFMDANLSPCKGKSFQIWQYTKLLPLQGALLIAIIPRALPWARGFSPFLNHMRNFSNFMILSMKKITKREG